MTETKKKARTRKAAPKTEPEATPTADAPAVEPEATPTSDATVEETPPKKTRRKAPASMPEPPALEEPAAEEAPKKKGGRRRKGGMTLGELAAAFLTHLEQDGWSQGTALSYAGELGTATAYLGADTAIADLTAERVAEFFGCDAVMRTRNGTPKAPPTYLKTRRILRLALIWAAEQGHIAKAPIPESLSE